MKTTSEVKVPSIHALTTEGRRRWKGGLLVIAILCFAGCGGRSITDQRPNKGAKDARKGEAELESLTNVGRRPANQERRPVPQSASSREERQINLLDLKLVLHKVTFDKPIDSRSSLFFSETEITNEMFAAFLNDTDQWRDDAELVAAKVKHEKSTTNPDGSVESGFSTGSPFIEVHRPSALWHQGEFPNGESDYPVTFITIAQAISFCNWLTDRYKLGGSFRPPTKEEWLFAAYGIDRKFPWGDDEREWRGNSTEPVDARPQLRTPDGLFGMWGNVSELVLSHSNGYGGEAEDQYSPEMTQWLGTSYEDEEIVGNRTKPRQNYWGYTHSIESRSDTWGFRVVFVPEG